MIRFQCACGRGLKAGRDLVGKLARCPGCAAAVTIPAPDPTRDCPHCGRSIEPPPSRRRKCPHCSQWVRVRGQRVLTEAEAEAFDREQAEWYARKAEEARSGPPRPLTPEQIAAAESNPHAFAHEGKVYTLGASTGGGGKDAVQRGIANGTFSGWHKGSHAEDAAKLAEFFESHGGKKGSPPR